MILWFWIVQKELCLQGKLKSIPTIGEERVIKKFFTQFLAQLLAYSICLKNNPVHDKWGYILLFLFLLNFYLSVKAFLKQRSQTWNSRATSYSLRCFSYNLWNDQKIVHLEARQLLYFLSGLHIQPLFLFYGNMQGSDLDILFLLTTFSNILHKLLQNPYGVIGIRLQF